MNFIINRWVRGKDFFGRSELLEQIKNRRHKPIWILGNRRVGKTSLLRQIQQLSTTEDWPNSAALYWDLQGAGNTAGLKEAFLESLEDNESITQALGLNIEDLEECSLNELLSKFRRKVKGLKQTLLYLLIDECEELVDIVAREPSILASFRKLSQGDFPFSIIMTGSWRMMDLDESESITSPFLPDFLPPILLGPFMENEALELLDKSGLPLEEARIIYQLSLGNPHLLQVLGELTARTGSLEKALAELKLNRMAHYYFQSNFNCLPPSQRTWYASGQASDKLATMTETDPNYPYIEQSALLQNQNGEMRVSPLLRMLELDLEPSALLNPELTEREATTSRVPTADIKGQDSCHLNKALVQLKQCRRWPLLLAGEPGEWAEPPAAPEPMSSLEARAATDTEIRAVLQFASPEYVKGEPATEATAIYLAGLYWYRALVGKAAFDEQEDPWEQASCIASKDVPILPSFRESTSLSGKQAMILLRCLKANPDQRYPSLSQLQDDLEK